MVVSARLHEKYASLQWQLFVSLKMESYLEVNQKLKSSILQFLHSF